MLLFMFMLNYVFRQFLTILILVVCGITKFENPNSVIYHFWSWYPY